MCVLCVGMSQSRSKRTRTGASSSRTNQAPVLDQVRFGSEAQATNYGKQIARNHLGTRWYCEKTANELFMHEDIVEAFGYMGASSLLNMRYHTYGALTSEFLSSFETTVVNQRDGGTISFRLGNEDRRLTILEWCRIFGFWNCEMEFNAQSGYPVKGFWARITGQAEVPSGANIFEREIASPLFRVIHRVLGNTLWAKKENSRVTYKELAALYHALYDFEQDAQMNFGFELLVHLRNYKDKTTDTCFGGMITHLAVSLGVQLDNYSYVVHTLIDKPHLLFSKVVEYRNGVFGSIWNGRRTLLSAPSMDLLWVPNWYETWAHEPFPRSVDRQDEKDEENLRERPRRVFEEEMPGPRVDESEEAYARRLEREINEEVGATDEENEQPHMETTGMHQGEQTTFGGERTFVGGASGSQPSLQ